MPERTQPQRLSHDTTSDTRTPETSPPEHAHPPAHSESLAGAMQLYPQAAAGLFAAMQAVLLLPLRSMQSWQEAWLRVVPR